ncbi:hypothetical protein POV95_07775 [Klebsiella variicola]|uniref:hypothetical protein n=1 Tax=Klebsiella variicola TaxID=244366 RepID=UPI0028C7AAC2|nr:hypothetical protein [Klebsiella pneumoniae]
MHQDQEERALQRGARAAVLWKKLRLIIFGLDHRCVVWAQRHNLPVWSGHIPIISLVIASVVICAIGGFLLISAVFICWAAALVFGFLRTPVQVEITNWDDHRKSSYERFSWEADRHKNTYDKHSWHQDD